MGVRRTSALSIIRYGKAQLQARSYVTGLADTELPNPLNLVPAPNNFLRNYHYQIKVSSINGVTGEITERNITVATDNLLTKEDAFGAAEELLLSSYTEYSEALNTYDIDQVLVSPDFYKTL